MLPYTPINEPRRMALTPFLLSGVATAPVAGIDSDVATYVVADGSLMVLLADQPMKMFLQARAEDGRVAGAPGAPVNVDVSINTGGRRLQRTTRTGRAFPALNHPDVCAYTQVTGNAWTPARVMACDFATGVVSVETPSNAGKVRVYYTFGDGEISLRAGRPFGASSGSVQLFRMSARGLHETDQTDRDAAPFAARDPLPIPQNFTVALNVRAQSAVYFDGLAQHEVVIPVSDVAIQVHDAGQLAELAERQLKGV